MYGALNLCFYLSLFKIEHTMFTDVGINNSTVRELGCREVKQRRLVSKGIVKVARGGNWPGTEDIDQRPLKTVIAVHLKSSQRICTSKGTVQIIPLHLSHLPDIHQHRIPLFNLNLMKDLQHAEKQWRQVVHVKSRGIGMFEIKSC